MILQKEIDSADILNKKSNVKQLVDILQVDIAGIDESDVDQNTRREYHTFVTGGTGLYPVTSSLFQTVYDQDYELQTSNEILDITVGIRHDSSIVTTTSSSTDASGKPIFPDTTLMMREKINLYKMGFYNLRVRVSFRNSTLEKLLRKDMPSNDCFIVP